MTKKILLFLVEGLSDKDALDPIISELVDDTRILFEVLRCDLTTNNSNDIHDSNMKLRITSVVKRFLENNRGIKKNHIEKIIFLSDTDGCYIDEDDIYFSKDDLHFRYEDDGIYTNRADDAIKRNRKKSKNLNILSSTSKVFSLPIETYYFSCNLDHLLHGERNLERGLKEDYAFDFADRYENREIEFVDFISNYSVCLACDYVKTWALIKQDKNSLLRYTNLLVFFFNNIDLLKSEIIEKVMSYK